MRQDEERAGLGSRIGVRDWGQGLGSGIGVRDWGQGLGSERRGIGVRIGVRAPSVISVISNGIGPRGPG